jgi:hypothetical protein
MFDLFPYLPIIACACHSHHSILSFAIENLRLGSIRSETTELEGSEHIINTLLHLSWHPKGIGEYA